MSNLLRYHGFPGELQATMFDNMYSDRGGNVLRFSSDVGGRKIPFRTLTLDFFEHSYGDYVVIQVKQTDTEICDEIVYKSLGIRYGEDRKMKTEQKEKLREIINEFLKESVLKII